MNVIPDKRSIVGLVKDANDGKLCLPDFQRDFVWPRDLVADLVRSILRQYYVGSLLLLRCDRDNPPFAPVFLRGAKPIYKEPHPELLVLDGQQRLTALLYALTAPDLRLKDSKRFRRFFVDLKTLLKEPDDDEIVFDLPTDDLDGLDQTEVQYERWVIPCAALFSLDASYKWLNGMGKWLAKERPTENEDFENSHQGKLLQIFSDFASFEVPLVELPRVEESDPRSIGRVCAIFEKLNSTGVELSVYDLLTARLYRSKIRLHQLWDKACDENKLLKDWSDGKADQNKFGVLVLRTLALRRGLEVKPSMLINLKPEKFEEDWKQAAAAMNRALELLTLVGPDGFGVFDKKWLPGFGLLPVLAALRTEIEARKLGEEPRTDLRRWYWCNLFIERYSSAIESKSRKDYVEMMNYWKEGKVEPSVFTEARGRIGAEGYTIRESASYASSVYSGVFCLLALRGARDWIRGEAIQLQDLQDHHIFPQDYLKKRGFSKRVDINTILNRTLISDETNGKIKNKSPAEYISSADIFPSGTGDSLLLPHFISQTMVGMMSNATKTMADGDLEKVYGEFLRARESAIASEIRKVCGISP